VKKAQMMFKSKHQELGLDQEYMELNLNQFKQDFQQFYFDRGLTNKYQTFKHFKRQFENQEINEYLMDKMFLKSFKVRCQRAEINEKPVGVYLVSQIKGVKKGVSKNGKPAEQAKVANLDDIPRLLHINPQDDAELTQQKAGARLAFEIFFKEGFYEKWVKEIYYELLIPGNRESEIHAKEIMNLFIKKKEEITREFLSR